MCAAMKHCLQVLLLLPFVVASTYVRQRMRGAPPPLPATAGTVHQHRATPDLTQHGRRIRDGVMALVQKGDVNGTGQEVVEGSFVRVVKPFKSNDDSETYLKYGLHGRVYKVDKLGDALIEFEGIEQRKWVLKQNFDKLQVLSSSSNSSKRESCPPSCSASTCKRGDFTNGGMSLVNGTCTHWLSKAFDGVRYCGCGAEYKTDDYVDCTGCASKKRQKTFKVAGSMQLTGKFESVGLRAKAALELWQYEICRSSHDYFVDLHLVDDGSDIDKAAEINSRFAVDDSVNVIMAPYTSGASLKVVQTVAGRKPVLVWGGASAAVFEEGYEKVFGFMSTASGYMHTGLNALYERGAKSAVMIKNMKPFSESVCDGATSHAKTIGMTILNEFTMKDDGSDAAIIMEQLQAKQTDVVVICGHLLDVEAMTKEMFAAEKYPYFKTNMLLATQVGDPVYRKHVAPYLNDQYMMMPTQWVPSSTWKVKDPVVGWGNEDFVSAFAAKFGSAPSYHAAAAAASVVALSNAIKAAGGDMDMDAVIEAMRKTDLQTFYGRIKFAPSGALDIDSGKPMVTVQNHPDNTFMVVAPPAVEEAKLVYPMPCKPPPPPPTTTTVTTTPCPNCPDCPKKKCPYCPKCPSCEKEKAGSVRFAGISALSVVSMVVMLLAY